MNDSNKFLAFIAVHSGAGFHSPSREPQYKLLCKRACKQVMKQLREGLSAVDGVANAVKILEDSPLTNAGRGSNLTLGGHVECDASLMDGCNLLWAGVGALSNIQNPVEVAKAVLHKQQQKDNRIGRVPPCLVVGQGALWFAQDQGFNCCADSSMVTGASRKSHKKALKLLNASVSDQQASSQDSELLDTVGCVCIDCHGNMAAGVSSGGVLLKQSGRVGQAGCYGSGCWADNMSDCLPGIAVSTSGCGEHILKTLLAKTCAQQIQIAESSSLGLSKSFKDDFLTSRFLQGVSKRYAGVLAVRLDTPGKAELVWGHSTQSMCIGYMASSDIHAKASISRLAPERAGVSITMQGVMCDLEDRLKS